MYQAINAEKTIHTVQHKRTGKTIVRSASAVALALISSHALFLFRPWPLRRR
jgi:hypothetical protein